MSSKEEYLDFFAQFIKKELGIIYHEANLYQLETRLNEITKELKFESIDELYKKAKTVISPDMKRLILDVATNNETSFFRDGHIFDSIAEIYRNSSPAPGGLSPFSIWSAACSRGQEIYSVAMTFDEVNDAKTNGWKILATDISERALEQAKSGVYSQLEVQRGLVDPKLSKYFEKTPGEHSNSWKVKADLQRNIAFKKQNLLDSFTGLGSFDLILCRNVLIYQDVEERKRIVARMYDALNSGGHLIMGAAESLMGINEDFETVRLCGATIYKKPLAIQKAS